MQLQPHQERVIAERAEVSTKVDRLDAFIRSDSFDMVPIDEQVRLARQLHIMMSLRDVLDERIAAFR
jgi:hypothetical protein